MITTEALLAAALIFILRVVNNAIATMRIILTNRGRKLLAAVLAFLESVIFAVVIAQVVSDLNNWLNLTAYAGGFAAGGWFGMWLEERFITSYRTVSVITHMRGHEIAEALRSAGYGVTETVGQGKDGEVLIVRTVVTAREVPKVAKIIRSINNNAFIELAELRAIRHGWIQGIGGKR
ncbi:MAG: DUF2179 domain-containing protein [Chloroflexi bacterium]|nr:MAG: DUF2179 domain-containing protein [Chloroflexota bacterium]